MPHKDPVRRAAYRQEHYRRSHEPWVPPSGFVPFEAGRRVGYVVNDATGCWEWLGSKDKNGYGKVVVGGRGHSPRMAHRVYYERTGGVIPDGHVIDHLCRVPGCVNPSHVEPVPNAENLRRGLRTRLTREAVTEMRRMHSAGEATQGELEQIFGLSRGGGHVCRILAGKAWA